MTKISVDLPEELINYMDENPYITEYSKFIAMLIRKFQKDCEEQNRQHEADRKNPKVLWDFTED